MNHGGLRCLSLKSWIGAMEYDRNRPRADPKIYEPTNSEMKT